MQLKLNDFDGHAYAYMHSHAYAHAYARTHTHTDTHTHTHTHTHIRTPESLSDNHIPASLKPRPLFDVSAVVWYRYAEALKHYKSLQTANLGMCPLHELLTGGSMGFVILTFVLPVLPAMTMGN